MNSESRWYRRVEAMNVVLAIAVILVVICLAYFEKPPPSWQPSFFIMLWLLAAFFPGTAMLYLMFEVATRCDEITDSVFRYQLYRVYYPGQSEKEAQTAFRQFLDRRLKQYYSPLELAAFALIAGAITYLGEYLIAGQLGLDLAIHSSSADLTTHPKVILIGAAFYGAVAGSMALVLKKYRSFDIYPSTYLQVTVGLILASLLGLFAPLDKIPVQGAVVFLALGFFVSKQVDYFGDLLHQRLAEARLTPPKDEIKTDLDMVIRNSAAIESINQLSLQSLGEFVKAHPLVLYLNMPQPIGVINGWLDEALLAYYFAEGRDTLRKAYLTRFTQLLEYLVDEYSPKEGNSRPEDANWKTEVDLTGDVRRDQLIARAVQGIVRSYDHHTLLGVIAERYRRAYFADRQEQPEPSRIHEMNGDRTSNHKQMGDAAPN
jgi:hypothetical protein